jgi:hypothetical protein
MSSNSGMESSEIDSFSQICRIIRECGRSGVKKLQWGTLNLEFHPPTVSLFSSESQLEQPKASQMIMPWASPPEKRASKKDAEPPQMLMTPQDFEAVKAFEEFQLAIDDPLAYEEQQIGEGLEAQRVRGNGEGTEDRGSEQAVHGGRRV